MMPGARAGRRPVRQIGIEEELLLVDAATGQPRAIASEVLHVARSLPAEAEDRAEEAEAQGERAAAGGSLGPELKAQMVETDTPPERSLTRLAEQLRHWRSRAAAAAAEVGAMVVATGTAPVPVDPQTFADERYREITARFGLTAEEQLSCGCHVHVSVESEEEAVAVLDRIRIWLPVLLALSANSPYWQGLDTGYHSYRPQLLTRWPTSGPTPIFGSAATHRAHVDALVGTGVLVDEAMVYADARASARFPTVEIRIADVCLRARDAVLVAALGRGLVEAAAQDWRRGEPPAAVSVAMLRLATWQAAKSGANGALLDPRGGHPRAAREVIEELLAFIEPALAATDRCLVQEGMEDLWRRGTGADCQRQLVQRRGRLDRAVLEAARITAES